MDRFSEEPLDEEERDLAEALEKVDIESIQKPSAEAQRKLNAAAREYQKAEAKMNIRIDPKQLEMIRERAAQEGLKNQTLVKSVLHKYVTGRLVER